MDVRDYRAARDAGSFQRIFLRDVVVGDGSYYAKVAALLEHAGVSQEDVVLSDLCRASFVLFDGQRMVANEKVLEANDSLFAMYREENRDWHRARIDAGGFKAIVALGRLAARGVEKLLEDDRWAPLGGRPLADAWAEGYGRFGGYRSPDGRVVMTLCVPHPGRLVEPPMAYAGSLKALLLADTSLVAHDMRLEERRIVPASTSSTIASRLPVRPEGRNDRHLFILVRPRDEPGDYANVWEGDALSILVTYETVVKQIEKAQAVDVPRIFFQLAPIGGSRRRVLGSGLVSLVERRGEAFRVHLQDWKVSPSDRPPGRSYGSPWYWASWLPVA